MRTGNSLGNRLVALTLSIIMVLGMLPAQAIAQEFTAVAQIGDTTYDTLADAVAAAPAGIDQVTTIKLLQDTADAFDVGTSTGSSRKNLKLDLNGNTLTLSPSVGSVGTKSNGIRVLAYSKLEIVNGDLVCSSVAEDNVKVGIANYGTLTLTDVDVKKGDLTIYTINNRGALTLNGKTTVESGSTCAITNDPYDLYYTTDVNASVTCNSSEVVVDSMLVERYERTSNNNGGVELNISAGYFGKIVEDGKSAVSTNYNVTGGTIGVSTTEELEFALNMVKAGAEYSCPQQPVTIQLKNSIAGSFDVGTSTGKAPKNIVLDLNRNTLTLKPGVGSFNTKSNGIRVLAYSKLEIQNGTIICSSEEADNVKIGIANYSDLTLDSVAVKSGDLTIYTINNRGKLTLKGTTSVENAKAPHGDYADSAEFVAITNDPYNLYYSTPINAEINCADSNVVVGNVQLETYGSKGDIELNITNGSFGGVYAPAAEGTVTVKGAISGGTFGTDVSEYCSEKFTSVEVDDKYVTQYVKDDQVDFSFADKEPEINFNDNAENKYTFVVQNPKGTVTYAIMSGSEHATINAGTGELTVNKPGVVIVKASDTGNDLYNPAEATYTLTINKDDQSVNFATPVPEDQWIGAPFMNTVSGGNGTGEISYWLVDGENLVEEISGVAKIDKATGELTFLCVGTQITVKAVKAADDYYNETSATYTVTATKKEPTEIAFATTGPITITYNPENLSFKNDVVGCGDDDVITWSIVSGDAATLDTATGALTINKAGTIVIKATVAESPYYFEKAIEYTLVINPANQADLNIGSIPGQITYSPVVQEGLIVGAGGSGTGTYGYEIVEGNEFAEINAQTGAIKVLKAGNFVGDEFVNGVIKVKITKAGDDCYNAAEPVYVTISLARADQSAFGYGDTDTATVTYNDNNNKYTVNATGGQSSKDVVYTIISGDAATVKDSTGVVTITKAGTVIIKATKPADDCYNAIEDTFTLTINKDEQDYSFTEKGTIPLTYGKLSYTNELIKGAYVSTTNKPVYTISQNNIGASVNAETGEVTFADSEGKVGKATITVTVAEDACYKEFTTSYEIDVSYLTTDVKPTTDGETKNTSGWYTDKVVIKAPDGYTIAYDNNLNTEWKDKIPYTEEGINNATVYLKNSNGYITDKITVADIKLDTGNPDEQAITISYNTPTWEKVLERITFGIYKSDTLLVKISAKDTNSGIASLTYNIGGEDVVVTFAGETSVSHSFTINAQYRNKVILKATDVAGREIEKNSEHTLILDTKIPELDAAYEYASGQHNEYNDILYTQGDVTIHFTIEETNFDLSNTPVVTVDDAEKAVNWTRVENTDEWKADLSLSGNGDYVVKVTFTDIATNEMVTYVQEIHIDDVAPVLDVTYDNDEARNENNYKADRTATIKVTEHNFEPAEVKLTVTAKDITGAAVDISAKAYADYAKNPANWTQTGDVWTLNTAGMEFDIDAIYSVKLEYTDLAENAATTYTTEFVVDKTISSDVTIEYSTSIVDKVLETVTFGLYKGDVVVTVTAKDQTAGVEYFEITYTQVDGANNSNKATYTTEKLAAVQDASDKTVFTATHTIEAQARGKVSVNLIDKAGNTTGKAEEYVVVADTIAPGLEYQYTFTNDQVRVYNNIFYTQGETKVKFTITEANFDLSLKAAADETVAPAPVLTVNDVAQDITWTQIDGTDKWETEITLTGNGDYVIELSYTDRSTNAMATYTKEVHIDNVAPVFDVTYDNNEARNENNYKADRTATIKVTEHNFEPAEVKLTVTAKDITGAAVDISAKAYADYAKNPANWTQTGDVWTLNTAGMEFDIDAIYSVKLEYTDLAENVATTYTTDFVIDKTVPANIQIKYSTPISDSWNKILNTVTFGYYPYTEKVEVTLIADDITSGVDFFTWTYTKEANTSDKNKTDETKVINKEDITYSNNGKTATASFVIDAQARGYISVDVTDKAGNTSGKSDNTRINVVDTIAPTREVSYQPERVLDAATLLDVSTFVEGDNVILYYEKEAVVTFTINEANFYAEDVVIKVNGVEKAPTDWTQNGDVWTGTITISGDGDYVVTMTYTDRSTNEMVAYQSQKIAIDNTDPTIKVEYNNNDALNTNNYKADRTATITIVEHNFRADDVKVTVTARDVQGNPITVTDYAAYLSDRSSWTTTGDTHVAKITYSTDAIYTFDIEYTDLIGNSAADFAMEEFVIDHAAPTNLKIEYSDSVVEKIIEAITFGFYKPEVIVTLTADDITAGVDYFEWTYTKEDGTSDKNAASNGAKITAEDIVYSNNGLTATATFKIPANARGYVSATVTDRAGNNDSKVDDKHINVVDNIAPTISVKYEADNADTLVQFTDKDLVTVESFEKAAIAHYNGNVTAKIVINEANFFEGVEAQDGVIYNVGIKLTKTDDNGNETVYEYLPAGAVQKYAGATPKYITWATSGDEHSFSINYTDNADYVLEIDYTDLSSNEAGITANDGNTATKAYKSKVVTVDKVAPVVSVKYGNEKIIHTIDGRDYFDAEQTATITVEEHNFRADDFAASVIAKNILGDDVNVEDFKATLSDDSKWTKNGNTYTITIKYSVDANYTFDYEYKDLAQNPAAEYTEDLFTVDTTAPENLTVTYSTSVLDKVLESITFGYYNAEMTVTITAEDDTAGIYYFVYSYIKSEGVSDVNTELINDKIEDANSRIVHEGKKSTTSFTIPKLLLANDNQFNGTVKFTAFDRSENNTEKVDNQRIVVDNIAPTATITYNQPVQNANNISYYAGNIDAKIVINEANFYSEDVVVTVTKDGANHPVNVKWVDDSVDVHTGTFTLTADGDYIVTVEYKDRSNNQMTKYTSNRLTLDTKAPSVSVSNIKNNSANKDEKYGFTITATDINLDASSFKPVLTATVRKDDGSYENKTVSLGDMKTVEAGKTYTFTVDNLEEDAVYSLVCTLKDMSGNQYSKIVLSDNESYDEVRFSINRNGSTFAVDKDTDALVNQYYVYSVNEDVVIEEVNVDPVETYVVKLNGEKLTEGADYTTTLSNKDGEWSKRTYIISKDLFKSEGEYSIVVESTDKAETTAYSDVKNLNVSFVVDQTAPVLTISGLENGGRYQVEEQTVTIIPTDDGGRLYSIKVAVLNSDGEPLKDANGQNISVRFEMSGEDFLTYLTENGGKVTFTVPEGLENQVQIICNDYAVNADGKTNEFNETFIKVTVSQSQWIIFYANKPLFYGTIAGVVLLVGGIVALIVFLKKKKAAKK